MGLRSLGSPKALSFFLSSFPPLWWMPRSSKVNLIQKWYRSDEIACSVIPARALSFFFSLSLTQAGTMALESAESTRELPLAKFPSRLRFRGSSHWDMSLTYSTFPPVCACIARCIVGIHRVQCKNCAPGTFARGKILNQRLRHLLENAMVHPRLLCIV